MYDKNKGTLYEEIQNGIATLTFGHPLGNSFPSFLLDRLTKTLQSLSQNNEVKVILLKSEGERAFCGGASFEELLAVNNLEEGKRFFSGFANVINAMRNCSKLIIGRIQGKAVGGGLGLVAACDYAMATEAASIKLSEFTIGIGPFVIEPAVTRKIGVGATGHLTLDATQWQTAYWAKEKGLYARVFESIEDMDKEIMILSERLSKYNPKALTEMKKTLWKGTENWNELLLERAAISGELVLSPFTKNALEKIRNK